MPRSPRNDNSSRSHAQASATVVSFVTAAITQSLFQRQQELLERQFTRRRLALELIQVDAEDDSQSETSSPHTPSATLAANPALYVSTQFLPRDSANSTEPDSNATTPSPRQGRGKSASFG